MRKGKSLIRMTPILIASVSTIIVEWLGVALVEIPIDSAFHFGLMTVNALFGGFLYSNYGLLVGLSDNKLIQKVKCTSIMEKRNTHVLCGIVYATVSVLCGLAIALLGNSLHSFIVCFAINGEIVFMIAAIAFYLLSLSEMNRLLKALNKDDRKISEQGMDVLKEQVRAERNAAVSDRTEDAY